ncbi:MAG: hypothetical protein LBS91_03270 [Clostridiales Family XIII bacterium]|nr:hypothetical protein [Clostridiales Family XIII bacterium]
MSEAVPLFTMRRSVTDTDADFARRLKPTAMFGFFQDIAALHAANLGASVERLHEELNVAWILMRVRLEIDRYPVLAQDVTVETWPQEPRALYERDYTIRDTGGNALVRAGSTWVIMNLGTREIKRDKFLDYAGVEVKKDRALGSGVARLKPIADADVIYEKEIKYSDLDYNIHANNAKYVDYIMDSFSFGEHRGREVKAIEVHYVNETGPGSVLEIRRKRLGGGQEYVGGVRKGDRASVFNAIVEWGEI